MKLANLVGGLVVSGEVPEVVAEASSGAAEVEVGFLAFKCDMHHLADGHICI